ncbi:MAG TPA: hypothetical protein VEY10_14275 [Flavisolibacter sp.]|jgi:hypothetical protein|nr:hypothetical protein [Flavisolibacter sp.]
MSRILGLFGSLASSFKDKFLFLVRGLRTANKVVFLDMMRPQDIVILVKLVSLKDKPWHYRDLSAGLFIPLSEISASLKRSEKAGLYGAEVRSVHRLALMEFIQYGLKYVFPTSPGAMVTGLGTAHSHPYYIGFFPAEMQYAWPDEKGDIRGLMIEPLHPNVSKAAGKDELLYKLLASIDILRVGKVREIKMAMDELKKAIL